MDRERSRHYLHAMGVQMWRQRKDDCGTERQDDALVSPVREGPDVVREPPPLSAVGLTPPLNVQSVPADGNAVAAMDWDRLRQAVSSCRACALCATRTQPVFGVGRQEADLMIIGEAPGADEDRLGEPFVGRAGQLLDLMLTAIGLDRRQVFIANILKCRPPGNRDPRPEETFRCAPFLMQQISLVRPRVILAVGRISAQTLLKVGTPIGTLRGRWHALGPEKTPLMVTYHPAYLLRSPEQKAKVWQDLLQVARRLHTTEGGASRCGMSSISRLESIENSNC